jgi:hypothetical protein
MSTLKPCKHPGCAGLTAKQYCAMHKTTYRKQIRPTGKQRGYDYKWRKVRKAFLAAYPECVVCGKPAKMVDHIQPLAFGGDHRYENLQSMCWSCHKYKTDQDYKAVQYNINSKVTLVWGSPGSGKTTYVKEHMSWGDIILDLDKIYEALTLMTDYNKPINLLSLVIKVRNYILRNVPDDVKNVWVISGMPNKEKRESLVQKLQANEVFIDVSRSECKARISNDDRRDNKDQWYKIVDNWFNEYNKGVDYVR